MTWRIPNFFFFLEVYNRPKLCLSFSPTEKSPELSDGCLRLSVPGDIVALCSFFSALSRITGQECNVTSTENEWILLMCLRKGMFMYLTLGALIYNFTLAIDITYYMAKGYTLNHQF